MGGDLSGKTRFNLFIFFWFEERESEKEIKMKKMNNRKESKIISDRLRGKLIKTRTETKIRKIRMKI